jgi:proline iminopeptidase
MQQWVTQPTTQAEFEAYLLRVLPFFFSSYANLEKNLDVFKQTSMSFHAQQGQRISTRPAGSLASRLAALDIPTLIIVGEDDFICSPASARFIHGKINDSTLLVIEKAGHFPWLEQPEAFFEGIRSFLKTNSTE